MTQAVSFYFLAIKGLYQIKAIFLGINDPKNYRFVMEFCKKAVRTDIAGILYEHSD